MYDKDPIREMGIYVLVELQNSAEIRRKGIPADLGQIERYFQMLKSFDAGVLSAADAAPYLRDWVEGHKKKVKFVLENRHKLPPNMGVSDGVDLLHTLERISKLSDDEIIEALELTKPTLTQILEEYEQARLA
ncbi:hypothetical protein HYV80_00125 [Candidatus Woesearchaeota archaeon]|nr:hypothetical protein [Candidatus Woesearchaeota archaeon]